MFNWQLALEVVVWCSIGYIAGWMSHTAKYSRQHLKSLSEVYARLSDHRATTLREVQDAFQARKDFSEWLEMKIEDSERKH